MAAKLSLLSLNQLQQLAQSSKPLSVNHQGSLGSASPDVQWVWNHKVSEELDDSWEVRAFAEDYTRSVSGSTWPPKSYTCTFCKREFRSAQALGGHMNVHRCDRVTKRFNHTLPSPATAIPAAASTSSASNSTLVIPARELSNLNGGFCLLYQPPSQSNATMPSNWVPTSTINSYSVLTNPGLTRAASPQAYSSKIEVSLAQISNTRYSGYANFNRNKDFAEDLDLELRLGQNPSAS